MPRSRPSLRLFVAIYPPPETVRGMREAVGPVGKDGDEREGRMRMTPADQVHLTLQFIGDTPVRDLDRVMESVARSTSGLDAFALAPQRLISLPERGPARLMAIETDAPPELLEIKRRLVARLAGRPRGSGATDRFLPHLTVCRFRPPLAIARRVEPISLAPFPVPAARLMCSTLAPAGARHEEIARFDIAVDDR